MNVVNNVGASPVLNAARLEAAQVPKKLAIYMRGFQSRIRLFESLSEGGEAGTVKDLIANWRSEHARSVAEQRRATEELAKKLEAMRDFIEPQNFMASESSGGGNVPAIAAGRNVSNSVRESIAALRALGVDVVNTVGAQENTASRVRDGRGARGLPTSYALSTNTRQVLAASLSRVSGSDQ